jgi:predicted glycoside hydrolase/deacetylase ChbG (UPF0249 family)
MSMADTTVKPTGSPGSNDSRRPIWLCADDYGISPAVNKAIRDLVMQGRLNATTVMVVAPSGSRPEAASLDMLNAGTRRVAIGLHVTLTGAFRPISAGFRPTRSGTFLSLEQMFARGALRLLNRKILVTEIAAQVDAFVALFGRTPDFVDGHQHVHLFPRVRDAFLDVIKQKTPDAWVRQCGRPAVPDRPADRKSQFLDRLSAKFRELAAAQGLRTNPAFAGAYDYKARKTPEFARLFPRFLDELPADGVIMCHPGVVDAELTRLDPLTDLREREYAYFAGDDFPKILARRGFRLAAV